MRTLLYQQSNIAIAWDDLGWLYADWIGPQSFAGVKDGCEQILRLLQRRPAHSVLNDNTHAERIASGAPEWIGRDWFPRMRDAGLQRFAWVRSPGGLTEVAVEAALKCAPPAIANLFWTMGEAEAWLQWDLARAIKRKSGRISLPP